MFENLLKSIFGSKHDREVRKAEPLVDEINRHFESYQSLSDEELRGKTAEFKARIATSVEGIEDEKERREAEQATLEELLPEAFATVKDACRRLMGRAWDVVGQDTTWDMIPYDVQLIGGVMLHQGKIAEMATGEGKTLVATMPLYLNALTGRGAHLVTVNDYLATRDSQWMGGVYEFLGLTVGCIEQGMEPAERREHYGKDITYGTNNEFGFDYLRDNMAVRPEYRVQRGFVYAIVDEVDSVLIDEARTPLIISGPVEHSNQGYDELRPLVERLARAQNQWVSSTMSEAEKLITNPETEYEGAFKLLQIQRAAPKNKRFMKMVADQPGIKKSITRVENDYLRDKRMHEVDENLLFSIDEKSKNVDLLEKGRHLISPEDPELFVVPDLAAQLSELEGREELSAEDKVKERDRIYRAYAAKNDQIHSLQALLKAFSLYEKDVEYVVQDGKVLIVDEFTGRLMPGRRYSDGLHQAIESKERVRIEGETQTLATITLQNFFRMYEKLAGMTGTAETESSEFWSIYKLDVAVVPTHRPIARADHNDVIYRTKREKYNGVIDEIAECHERGQPVLVGTINVDASELLSRMLKRRGVKHNVLNAKFHQSEAEIVASAGQHGAVTIATNMAGRGTDIKLGRGIADLGGLHILGTERHEARRIDRQLRGRAGRQGDPGSSRFYMCLEDDLMRLFSSDRVAGLMEKIGVEEGEVIEHKMVTNAIGRAQKRVEGYNFEIRKHLLEYDNVMNQQRTVVYDLRNKALLSETISDEAKEAIGNVIVDALGKFAGPDTHAEEWDMTGLAAELSYILMAPVAKEDLECDQYAELEEKAVKIGERAYEARREQLGPDVMQQIERHLYLFTVDEHWRDHLYELDHLKGGIGLRAYGQRDPLIEYKKEAFTLFERLMGEVERDVVQRLFRVQVETDAMQASQRRPTRTVEQHEAVGAFRNAPAPQQGDAPPQQQPARPKQIKREGPRVGRNDPCPCGSGKKYKKCHMMADQGSGAAK